jgi:ubiquinone/menaquinone biosynthesis C-methylase UbiE
MDETNLKTQGLLLYSRLRSLNYFLQFQALNGIGRLLPFVKLASPEYTRETIQLLVREIDALLTADAQNIAQGVYPASVLTPEPLAEHLKRIPKLLIDGIRLGLRRRLKKTKDLGTVDAEKVAEAPDYYRRNFHFQTDGYLSKDSAELYDHQVELLFAGAADAMRRLFIPPLKSAIDESRAQTGDTSPLKFIEVGAGTGSATRFLSKTFDSAEIRAIDLSEDYVELAKNRWQDLSSRVSFEVGDATQLQAPDNSADVVYSVFMMHEMPREIRQKFIAEAKRVLKPGGFFAYVDSLQLNQNPAFDKALERFPVDFHEPFYTDYIKTPMSTLLTDFREVTNDHAFLSSFGVYQK